MVSKWNSMIYKRTKPHACPGPWFPKPTDHSSAVAEQFFSKKYFGSSYGGSVVTSPTSMHEDSGLIPGLAQWVKDPVLP